MDVLNLNLYSNKSFNKNIILNGDGQLRIFIMVIYSMIYNQCYYSSLFFLDSNMVG